MVILIISGRCITGISNEAVCPVDSEAEVCLDRTFMATNCTCSGEFSSFDPDSRKCQGMSRYAQSKFKIFVKIT